jgi:hypothetical protein
MGLNAARALIVKLGNPGACANDAGVLNGRLSALDSHEFVLRLMKYVLIC